MVERAYELLDFVNLTHRAGELACNLPYGEQRLLEIVRGLASAPKLMMLDEASAGMNSTEKKDLIQIIRAISQQGITVLMIEHDMKLAMSLSDEITVLAVSYTHLIPAAYLDVCGTAARWYAGMRSSFPTTSLRQATV